MIEPVIIGRAKLYCGDCRDILPTLDRVAVCITDPPYGCGKAGWDAEYPTDWYGLTNVERVVTITGSSGLRDTISMVGDEFIDVISARNLNGMTRGPIGFGNWLAAVISRGKPRQGPNFFEFVVAGEMPDHPSPKPVEYMSKLVTRVCNVGETVIDPFMGSGTTGVAATEQGFNFIGIEREPRYFDLARARIDAAQRQRDLFIGEAA